MRSDEPTDPIQRARHEKVCPICLGPAPLTLLCNTCREAFKPRLARRWGPRWQQVARGRRAQGMISLYELEVRAQLEGHGVEHCPRCGDCGQLIEPDEPLELKAQGIVHKDRRDCAWRCECGWTTQDKRQLVAGVCQVCRALQGFDPDRVALWLELHS